MCLSHNIITLYTPYNSGYISPMGIMGFHHENLWRISSHGLMIRFMGYRYRYITDTINGVNGVYFYDMDILTDY